MGFANDVTPAWMLAADQVCLCRQCGYESDDDGEFNGELCWDCVDHPDEDEEEALSMLERACYIMLGELHHTLWADWDISKPEGRRRAARWLAQQHNAVSWILTR